MKSSNETFTDLTGEVVGTYRCQEMAEGRSANGSHRQSSEKLAARRARYAEAAALKEGLPSKVRLQCIACGSEFETWRSRASATFCSRKCHYSHCSAPLAVRFWSKVDKKGPVVREELGPCWLWTGKLSIDGYGRIRVSATGSKTEYANRAALFLATGKWPTQALHHCDNPACVRAEHLYDGTDAQNVRDRDVRGRTASKLSPDLVRAIRDEVARGERRLVVAKRYGVDKSVVCRIVNGKTWKRVEAA